jgi:hypothetical protein
VANGIQWGFHRLPRSSASRASTVCSATTIT